MGHLALASPRLSNPRTVAIGASNVASSVVGLGCHAVMLVSTGNCHFNIGAVATASTYYLPANVTPLIVRADAGETVNIIQDGASTGNVFVADVTY